MASSSRFNRFRWLLSVSMLLIIGSSCGKINDLNGEDWQPDVPPSDSVFSRQVQIFNLGDNLPQGHKPLDKDDPLFFSLERFASIGISYRSTQRWDITFSGMYRSAIGSNNGAKDGFGYGTSAIGGILILDSPYSKVMDIPDDNQFQMPGAIGLDAHGFFGEPLGYAAYTFFGNLFRPDKVEGLGDPDPVIASTANSYQHLVYCLSEDFVKAFPGMKGSYGKVITPRTIIIRTAAGNYAKMEMQSFYKSLMDPLLMRRGPEGTGSVMSFRYIVVKADEKRFGFAERRKKLIVNMTTRTTLVEN